MEMLREEFSWKHFALKFHRVDVFCTAQWRWPQFVFVVYRLVMSAYTVFAFTHLMVVTQPTIRVLAFLTIWTYLVEMLFFLTGAALATFYHFCPHHFRTMSMGGTSDLDCQENSAFEGEVIGIVQDGRLNESRETSPVAIGGTQGRLPSGEVLPETVDANLNGRGIVIESNRNVESLQKLPWYVQFYWVLGNIIQVFALIVTVIYFGALYPSVRQTMGDANFPDINIHGVNSAMILIDVAVGARPVRLLHMLYPILYGTAYVIFSVIFWAVDPQNNVLYPNVLDWNQPGISTGVVIGLAVIGIPLLQLVHFGLYRLRLKLHWVVYNEPYM